ncbi:hypothetical protein AcV7_005522 [Taiwanofungus camphoratus]|nr:hypothetical protein AcV7_005522 [Antrodia cinnamomea]
MSMNYGNHYFISKIMNVKEMLGLVDIFALWLLMFMHHRCAELDYLASVDEEFLSLEEIINDVNSMLRLDWKKEGWKKAKCM